MATRPTLYINQFRQSVAPGDLDLQITRTGVITGVLSPNQATDLPAGQAVKLDTANTNATVPQFLLAADNEAAIGVIKRTAKRSVFRANVGGAGTIGDPVEVTYFGGPVVWEVANATILPQAQLEFATSGGYPYAQTLAAGKLRGVALDPAVASAIFRMITLSGLVQTA